MPKLEITANHETSQLEFDKKTITIGRHASNDIVLDDPKASRKHCQIRRDEGAFQLEDLDSQNGTWVGQNRVREATLNLGDTLRIGSTFIRIVPDEVMLPAGEMAPIATALVDVREIEELPPPPAVGSMVATRLAVRTLGAGPLSEQLASLMLACVNVPAPEGAPHLLTDVQLLDRQAQPLLIEQRGKGQSSDALQAFRQLLYVAFRTRVTDIHIEPKADVYSLRFRIDGILHPVGDITTKTGIQVLNVVKVLCGLDIAKRQVVQEGSFAAELPTRRVDFRISLTPTTHGQKLALRFLDKASVPERLEHLGMEPDALVELQKVCSQDAGLVIISGPTGSGKTTTLYTALRNVDSSGRNIVTIEDPVEYQLETATQISIDPTRGITFAKALSSILRQDPDVILVGEIRDQETAKMAMQAAMTGHLVLTTIHARDTVGTIFRLLDLGVEPFLIANSVSLCVAQRLVRLLCPDCKLPYRPDAGLIRRFRLEDRPGGHFYEHVGCKRCMNLGYRGRAALFEVLGFNPQLRDVILTEPTISEIRRAAGEWMFRTLADSGLRRIMAGETTIQEVDRVVGQL